MFAAADFGLAWELVAHEQQRRASILGLRGTLGGDDGRTSAGGTPFYMAPEIVGALLANQVLSATAFEWSVTAPFSKLMVRVME